MERKNNMIAPAAREDTNIIKIIDVEGHPLRYYTDDDREAYVIRATYAEKKDEVAFKKYFEDVVANGDGIVYDATITEIHRHDVLGMKELDKPIIRRAIIYKK